MSRTTLKKAIKDFDADELRQLIMDVYTRSKEAREILDFYAVPDIAAKREQIEKPIVKELTRRYKGSPKPRFTRIKAQIKRFANLDVGDQAVASLMGFVVLESVKNCGDGSYLSDATLSAIVKFFGETIDSSCSRSGSHSLRKLSTTCPHAGFSKIPFRQPCLR